ncbi:MAG: serine/threonine protein kinase [Bryobacteraceae bacterium]|nr:serine/threonine protein kinase [Bryobacteraceae bacterium]
MQPPPPGAILGNYRLLAPLGKGGMGVVYQAEDLKLRRTVAMKFLSAGALSNPEAKQRFLREAQAAGRLDHPNICHIYGLEDADGWTFIVMAFAEGGSLARKLEAGLTLSEALDLAIQVGEGLKAAHAKGIIHRDVKVANVLLNSDGVAQIADFGLARIEERSRITRPGTLLGTVASMAPEQIAAADSDVRTDVWGFGTMLYEMCTGHRPFQRGDAHQTMQAILHEDPAAPTSLNPALPAELDRILAKALAKPRDERYQHIDDLVADLRSLRRNLTSGQESLPAGPAASAEAPTATLQQRSWFDRLFRRR